MCILGFVHATCAPSFSNVNLNNFQLIFHDFWLGLRNVVDNIIKVKWFWRSRLHLR